MLGPVTCHVLAQLDSSVFLDFLESLTGITGLICDPHHFQAGLHETPPGGFSTVHTDFPSNPRLVLTHRLNVLVYLNEHWPDEWGGHLQLWSPGLEQAEVEIRPEAGTMVIFETGLGTPHGLPVPVACPPGEARRSLAAYFYTARARTPATLSPTWCRQGCGRGWAGTWPTSGAASFTSVPAGRWVRRSRQLAGRAASGVGRDRCKSTNAPPRRRSRS